MVDIATILAFLAAPPLAYLNFKVVTSGDMPEEHRPKLFMRLVSWLAITLMSLFSVIFIYWRFIK